MSTAVTHLRWPKDFRRLDFTWHISRAPLGFRVICTTGNRGVKQVIETRWVPTLRAAHRIAPAMKGPYA